MEVKRSVPFGRVSLTSGLIAVFAGLAAIGFAGVGAAIVSEAIYQFSPLACDRKSLLISLVG